MRARRAFGTAAVKDCEKACQSFLSSMWKSPDQPGGVGWPGPAPASGGEADRGHAGQGREGNHSISASDSSRTILAGEHPPDLPDTRPGGNHAHRTVPPAPPPQPAESNRCRGAITRFGYTAPSDVRAVVREMPISSAPWAMCLPARTRSTRSRLPWMISRAWVWATGISGTVRNLMPSLGLCPGTSIWRSTSPDNRETSVGGRQARPGPSARPTGSTRPRHAPAGCGRWRALARSARPGSGRHR